MSKTRIPKYILQALKDARSHATLETASFDWEDSHCKVECRDGDFEGRPDTFIKERVRLHHSTWIIGPLDRAIAWAESSPAR